MTQDDLWRAIVNLLEDRAGFDAAEITALLGERDDDKIRRELALMREYGVVRSFRSEEQAKRAGKRRTTLFWALR